MIVELSHKKFGELTKREKPVLWTLRNSGTGSYLRDLFLNEVRFKHTPIVIARTNSGIVGWGARMNGKIHVFIRSSYRRRGIGTMIHDELYTGWSRVVRWNSTSIKFYDKIRKKVKK